MFTSINPSMKICFFSIIFLLFVFGVKAQKSTSRIIYTINECWAFEKGEHSGVISPTFDDKSWSIVNIPHTWNVKDAIDDIPGYYRGKAWYRKKIFIPDKMRNKQAYIYFEGANQETEVYMNGKLIGHHIGGYTRFCFDITPFLKYGEENQFAIRVDNSENNDIPPLAADFTFWGGIYRDVYLMFTEKIHFSMINYASSGIYIDSDVSEKQANIRIKSLVTNNNNISLTFRIETSVIEPTGKEIVKKDVMQSFAANSDFTCVIPPIVVNNPALWSPESPNIYTVYSRIYDVKSGNLKDEVSTPIGFRWYSFSPENGFYLNGKPCKLIGTSRHQDYYRKGNALPDEMHVHDIKILKEMGGNFLRVSHYPQDPIVMEMCDKLGILTSVEIPIISTISESDLFYNNSMRMVKEMIHQDYNRPSVIIWAYMNEIMLHPLYKKDSVKQIGYFKIVHKLAQDLEDTIRKEDSKRYTMMACNANFEDYKKVGLDKIPMILGWNLYQGWYSGEFSDFDKFLCNVHKSCPDKSLIVTEYGADVDSRLHSFAPQRFDFTVEYGNLYHEYYLKSIMQKPFIAGAAIWNLNDFYSEARKDAVPHVNNKGITSLNRELKDTYLLYQAALNKSPILKIGTREWKTRGGLENPLTHVCTQLIKIYTNLSEIEVFLNGKYIGSRQVKENIAQIDIPFKSGINTIEAIGTYQNSTIRDMIQVNFNMVPSDLNKFTEINVLLGSQRYFEDQDAAMIWIPEKEYTVGSLGYIGGKPYERKTRRGILNNSDINILGTDQDPIYQTQRVGIEAFKADVSDGVYSVYCYWANLNLEENAETLIYNLGNDAINTNDSENIFDVSINNTIMLHAFNPKQESKGGHNIIKKFIVNVSGGEGININFIPRKGKTIINALRIYRNY